MNTMNVNGQNGVATSALKNAVVKAVNMINKAQYGKKGFVKFGDDMRLSFDGTRFIKDNKDNFIFNGNIAKKCSNGRYDTVMAVIHYKNLDNDGLCLNDMVNGVLDAILNYIDSTIVKFVGYGDDCCRNYAEKRQNFRNEFFGSRLIVNNTEDFNSPDALEGPDAFIGLENASKECDGDMMACVNKYGHVFIDAVLNEYADAISFTVSNYNLDDTIKYCVKGALDYMDYNPKKKRLVGCSLVPDLDNWDDEDVFCNYFENNFGFDWDSCLEFYEEYCDDICHFSDKYNDQMEDALKDFDKESVYDKMPYNINWDGEYIEVSIEMDDFVNYIKNNMVTKESKLHLFNDEDLGFVLYYKKNIKQFYEDLKDMVPMVIDVTFYKDGLYIYYMDMNNMTIRKFYEIYKNDNGDVEEIINYHIEKFMSPEDVEVFENLWEKLEDGVFFITEDADGDLYVAGNEYFCMTYFNDDILMSQVYSSLMDSMKKEITKIENKIEKEIEESKYKVLDAFACESDFNVDYSEWWDYVMGKTPDWVEDKYYEKFCDVLYGYFVEYAKEYNYGVEKIDGGISLKMADYKN